MTQQRRPLNGGTGNGAPIALAAAGTVVHTIPTVAAERGGAVTDQLDLYLANNTVAAIVATVSIAGLDFVVTLPAYTTVQVLEAHPVLGSVSAPVVISVRHAGAASAVSALGSFTRA